MSVRQLIDLLQGFPDDMPVVVQSYEDGFDPVTDARTIAVVETPDRAWYVGVYTEADQSGEDVVLVFSKYNRTEREE